MAASFGNKYLRKIESKTRQNRIQNNTFRTALKSKQVLDVLQRVHLKWSGHIKKMRENWNQDAIGEGQQEERVLQYTLDTAIDIQYSYKSSHIDMYIVKLIYNNMK